jgi:hypothetical protein
VIRATPLVTLLVTPLVRPPSAPSYLLAPPHGRAGERWNGDS